MSAHAESLPADLWPDEQGREFISELQNRFGARLTAVDDGNGHKVVAVTPPDDKYLVPLAAMWGHLDHDYKKIILQDAGAPRQHLEALANTEFFRYKANSQFRIYQVLQGVIDTFNEHVRPRG